jgi:hypothetical protein
MTDRKRPLGPKVGLVTRVSIIGVAIVASATVSVPAEFRQLGPHIHGVSTLDVAADGQTVTMALQSPGADIVGFESQPTSDAQKSAVENATKILSKPLDLFAFPPAAQCTTVSAAAQEVFLQENTAAPPAAPDATPFDRYLQQAQHSDFSATYTLRCGRPEAISAIDFRFFDAFAGAQIVHVQLVSKRGQFVFDVTRAQPHLALSAAF